MSVDGHLGYFRILAIVDSAAVNIRVLVSFGIVVFSECMLKSGIVGSYDRCISSFFKECPYCLLQWLYHFTFPPTVQECSLFSTPFPAFIIYRLLDEGHSDRCEVISHCSFDLHFSNNE